MKTIRNGVFETNSSSTHSVTIMNKEDYDRWQKEGLYYDFNKESFVTYDEIVKKYLNEYDLTEIDNEDNFDEWLRDISYDVATSNIYLKDTSLEVDVTEYATKSGDEIVIICKHGYDY